MLQDGIFVRGDWIKDPANQATAVKFLEATFKGWIYCRDHYKACVNIVLANGPALPRGHQTWQMNEVNALIWPNKLGIGVMNPADYAKTANDLEDLQGHQEAGIEGVVPHGSREEGGREPQEAGHRRLRQGWKKAVVVLKFKGK